MSRTHSGGQTAQLIMKGRESHFDPDVVDAFLRVAADFDVVSSSDQPS